MIGWIGLHLIVDFYRVLCIIFLILNNKGIKMYNTVLTINAGSSSLKACLFTNGGQTRQDFRFTNVKNQSEAFASLLEQLGDNLPDVIGHRVVHGGDSTDMAALIDDAEFERLSGLVHLAPLHLPANLLGIQLCGDIFAAPQIACFDTAFHNSIPQKNYQLPIPTELGFRKYGFHGLNYAFIADELPKLIGGLAYGKVVVAHLGSGSSLCLMENLKSVNTTMSFTPSAGVVMATRPGDLDPGVLIELSKTHTPEEVSNIIYKQSGLLALSNGESSEMYDLSKSDTDDAKFAVDYFCDSIKGTIGSFAAQVGGIDVLVFTGGIGQNSVDIRVKIASKLGFLGLKRVIVVDADEEGQIYKLCTSTNHTQKMTTLLPCPFCGFQLDANDDDCIYPATRATYNETNDSLEYNVYELNCYTTGGGCGASVLGDSAEDCITKWNTRH
jgi:acetate kinase